MSAHQESPGQPVFRQALSIDSINLGELNPIRIDPLLYTSYETSSLGAYVLDNNKVLVNSRRMFNLTSKAPLQENFELIIDTDFEEFVESQVDNTIQILEDRINELLALLANQQSNNAVLEAELAALQAQLAALQNQPVVVNAAIAEPNAIPDTLPVRGTLYSDKDGYNGTRRENSLLSKNRKAIAFIGPGGNFAIRVGEYDRFGNELRFDDELVNFAFNNGETRPDFFQLLNDTAADPRDLFIAIGGLNPYQPRWVSPKFRARRQGRGGKLVLDDSGYLNLYDDDMILWSSYGFDWNAGGTFIDYTPAGVTPATAATPPPPPIPDIKSTRMLNTITFKRPDGTTLNLKNWQNPTVLMNVEIVTAADGTKTIKFKPELYMAVQSFGGAPFANNNYGQRWGIAAARGEILEVAYKESDWAPFGTPIEVFRNYRGKIANPNGINWRVIDSNGNPVISLSSPGGTYNAPAGTIYEFRTLYPAYNEAQFSSGGNIYIATFNESDWTELERTDLSTSSSSVTSTMTTSTTSTAPATSVQVNSSGQVPLPVGQGYFLAKFNPANAFYTFDKQDGTQIKFYPFDTDKNNPVRINIFNEGSVQYVDLEILPEMVNNYADTTSNIEKRRVIEENNFEFVKRIFNPGDWDQGYGFVPA